MADQIKHTKVNVYDFFFANKTRKTYTNVVVTLGLVAILILFAVRPTLTTISKIKQKTKDYEERNQKAETKLRSLRQLSAQAYNLSTLNPLGLKEKVDFLNNVFMEKNSIDTIFANLSNRAQKHNIAIKDMVPTERRTAVSSTSFEDGVKSPSKSYYNLSVTFEAKSLENVRDFLAELEGYKEFPIVSRVTAIGIDTPKVNTTQGATNDINTSSYVFNVSFVIYTAN